MSDRPRRHALIAEILASGLVRDQQDLIDRLARRGLAVTQATLSRDLKAMGVLKGAGGYTMPLAPAPAGDDVTLDAAIQREAVTVDLGVGLVVVRTRPGYANALAVVLDRHPPLGALGSIAGDDTIFVAMRTAAHAEAFVARVRHLLHQIGDHA